MLEVWKFLAHDYGVAQPWLQLQALFVEDSPFSLTHIHYPLLFNISKENNSSLTTARFHIRVSVSNVFNDACDDYVGYNNQGHYVEILAHTLNMN